MVTRWLAWVGAWVLTMSGLCAEARPHIVMLYGEPEYESTNTIPAFKEYLEKAHGCRCTLLPRAANNKSIPGLEALETADLVLVYVRRMTLAEEQLGLLRRHLDAGKPLIGLRTASHAFQNWLQFDAVVLGGNYQGHYGRQLTATARVEPKAAGHPILKNVPGEFVTGGALYRNRPLGSNSVVLMTASIAANIPAEPVAWTHTHKGGRVFYTSLGHVRDFEQEGFRQLLVNAVRWALDRPH